MNNFIRINDIDCDFTNFIITTKNVDSKQSTDLYDTFLFIKNDTS